MNSIARLLGIAGAAIALPSFVLNYIAHGGEMPDADSMDRLDGVFSLMFMAGAALVVAGIIAFRPSPLGRKGRYLLYVEAAMVTLASVWAVLLIADPDIVRDDVAVPVAIADACWPLHQAFMLVAGISAAVVKLWPSPVRYTLFGPAAGLAVLGVGAGTGVDLIAAIGIGAGWAVAGLGVAAAARSSEVERGFVREPVLEA
jgi:hypothetical protein